MESMMLLLDAILVPDFGQTKFDDQILNLGPFEQQFNENRSFTEGTDLFSKGNLLYSRRIGGPTNRPTPSINETIIDNPATVNLINALKVSGRTKDGLGIGIFNALPKRPITIENNSTKETRKEELEPLANYSVLLDQRFRKTLPYLHTNVTCNGSFRDANVSALVWDLNTKKYNLAGDFIQFHQ
jgi:hypothetical protein